MFATLNFENEGKGQVVERVVSYRVHQNSNKFLLKVNKRIHIYVKNSHISHRIVKPDQH